ncbi:MAG: hypothetical protein HZB56_10865 [Deltaproteobacteria bacterium]|nr:hypothetical protein [Deltaproteobacteria bacterium]
MSLKFDIEWLPAPGVRDPAEAATWAEMSLVLNGDKVSRVLDERLNSGRNSYFGSALPLAEWLVDAWPRLVHERRAPVPLREALTTRTGAAEPSIGVTRSDFYEWVGYHSLRAARDGGVVPDIRIVRFDSSSFAVRVNSDVGALAPGVTVRFIAEADARVPAVELQAELHRVIESAVARLKGVSTERVQRLRERWCAAHSEAATVAGRLGVDDETLSPDEREAIDEVVGDPEREILLGIAEGSAAASVARRLSEARTVRNDEPDAAPAGKAWVHLEETLHRLRLGRPWLTGWAAASQFRTAVGLSAMDAPAKVFPMFLEERCGWPQERQLFALTAPPTGVETVHVKHSDRTPVVMTATTTPQAHRFRLARSLYYFLFLNGPGDRAVSDSHLIQGRLSEANAFAAELLAPAELIRAHAPPGSIWTREQRKLVAKELGVDQRVVAHQIENRDLGYAA